MFEIIRSLVQLFWCKATLKSHTDVKAGNTCLLLFQQVHVATEVLRTIAIVQWPEE